MMSVSDFMALMSFLGSFFTSVFACINGVVIVSDGTSSLTLLDVFVGSAVAVVLIAFYKRLSE
jgi:hypothetical protein